MHSRTAAHAALLVAFAASASAFAPAPLSALHARKHAAPRSATRPAATSVNMMIDPMLIAKGLVRIRPPKTPSEPPHTPDTVPVRNRRTEKRELCGRFGRGV